MVTVTIIDELQILILFKQNKKQNKPEKNREKHSSFQLKKQCRAVICFSKF